VAVGTGVSEGTVVGMGRVDVDWALAVAGKVTGIGEQDTINITDIMTKTIFLIFPPKKILLAVLFKEHVKL
jgi:hypothetical protein